MPGIPPKDRCWEHAFLILVFITLLLLLHPYRGLVHDSRLYTIQALSHLEPGLYGDDLFVRFGSQDDYTVFSPFFAKAISWLGLESAASLLTFVGIAAFLTASWLLARTLLPPLQVAAVMVLMVLVPSFYGPMRIFHVLEEFLTPRQFAAALTLLAVAAWLTGRRLVAVALAIGATLVHPIMAVMGLAVLPVYEWIAPRARTVAILTAIGTALAAAALAGWIPLSGWQFDDEWYAIVINRGYLSLFTWDNEDWGRAITVLSTLGCAGLSLRGIQQRLALASVVTATGLLLLALVGGDLLRIVLVVQAQPWRVLWFATVIALLLLPPLFVRIWKGNHLERSSALLLAAAWLTPLATLPLIAAPLAGLAAWYSRQALEARYTRPIHLGSWVVLSVAVLHAGGNALLTWNEGLIQVETLPPSIDRLLTFNQNGVFPAIAILGGLFVIRSCASRLIRAMVVLALASVALALLIPYSSTWQVRRFPPELHAAYESWRRLIPPKAEVLWTEVDDSWSDTGLNTWLLLERPSYLSGAHAPNALFSRAAAIEMNRRAESIWGLLPFTHPFRPKGRDVSNPPLPVAIEPVCRNTTARFIVTRAEVRDIEAVPAPDNVPPYLREYALYICP
jgi:hypothetical protein